MRTVALAFLVLASGGHGRRVQKAEEQDQDGSESLVRQSKVLATLLQAFTPSGGFQLNAASAGARPRSSLVAKNHFANHVRPRYTHPVAADDKKDDEEEEEASGHGAPAGGQPQIDPEELAIVQKFQEHQATAAKLSAPVEVRSLVQYNHGFAVISTNSKQYDGFPSGSVVGFAPDEQGRPLFSFSKMSTHTQDLIQDKRCSLTVASKEFKGAADGRVNLIGECELIKDEEEVEAAKAIYREKHPGSFWTDFSDFKWYRMEVQNIRFVGGFARAGAVTGKDYAAAKPDPITAIQGRVAGHMNDDHRDASVAIVNHFVGLDVEDAEITSLDSLGMYLKVTRPKGQMKQFKVRVPWTKPLDDPKQVKGMIVQMTQASAASAPEKEDEKEDKEEAPTA